MWCKRMHKRRIATILLLVCGMLAFWGGAIAQGKMLFDAYGGISVRIADTPVSGKKLQRLLQEETSQRLGCTAAWTRGAKVTAQAEAMQARTQLRIVAVYGDMRQVAPMRLLCGSFLTENDEGGCLLDAESAQALFHSVDVSGAELTASGTKYTVRGVVTAYEPMLLVRKADAVYENLEFAPAELATGRANVEAFLYQYALTGDYALVQGGLFVRILRGAVFLPGVLLLAGAAAVLLRVAFQSARVHKWTAAAAFLAASAFGVAAILLLTHTFFWPQTYLPTKCADFAFWRTLADRWQADWKTICLSVSLPKEIVLFSQIRRCLWNVAAALTLEGALLGHLYRWSVKR